MPGVGLEWKEMKVTVLGSRKNLCGRGTVKCGDYPNLHMMTLHSTIYKGTETSACKTGEN